MRGEKIDKNLFIKNRKKITKAVKKDSIVIVNSNDQMPRNGDQFYSFRQNSDLFYLTGINQKKTLLILCPDHKNEKYHEALYILKSNKTLEIWEGHKYTKEEAREISGIENIYWLDDLNAMLNDIVLGAENIYLNSNEYPKFSTEVESRDDRFGKQIRKKFPNHHYERLAPIITKYRLQKEKQEIELINKACVITEKAFLDVLKIVKPGTHEFEIEAEITKVFLSNRANGHAYAPIIATAKNACALHYIENNDVCKDGDLVLMDFGAEYANYAADCTRTIPVNGKFTKRQKDVYETVLNILKKAIKLMVTGSSINKLNKEVNSLVEEELVKLGLITNEEIKNQNPDEPAYTKYFMHGTSHFIGLDVHDVGAKVTIFIPGMVLSCEPAIYIPEENMGIRLENDILITKNGQVDLMDSIPIEIEDIEKLMQTR